MNELQNLSTEYLFEKLLPSSMNVDGEIYHFKMIKGSNGYIINYENDHNIQLGEAHRSDATLRRTVEGMIFWLKLRGYTRYMPYDYRKRYERIFNIYIPNPRVIST